MQSNPATIYANDVISGKIPACKFVKEACNRYLNDLKNFDFDLEEAEGAVNFMQQFKHTKGDLAGEFFHLEPWEVFIIYNIFGFKVNGKRRFRRAYVEIPRKNGKTFLGAAVALYCFMADGEAGAEVYTAATKLDQAAICFEQGYNMLEPFNTMHGFEMVMNNSFNNRRVVWDKNLFKPLSKEHKTLDGLNPHCAIIDEYHAHPSDELYNVIVNGMGARRNPLLFTITTAGFDRTSACYAHREYCQGVLSEKYVDESLFAIIYTIDEDDDWTQEETWIKANPNWGVSVNPDFVRQQVKEAKESPSKKHEFVTKLLNCWVDSYHSWILQDVVEACKSDFVPDVRATCYGGLDLAKVHDFSSLHLDFPIGNKHHTIAKYYLSSERIRNWGGFMGKQIRQWVQDGWITVTEGEGTDYAYIEKDIIELKDKYNLISIGYDKMFADDLAMRLFNNHDVQMRGFGQGIMNMTLPTSRLEEMIIKKQWTYDGNPVTLWMFGNAEAYRDANLNVKIIKSKDPNKNVDGVIANIMAIGEAIDENNKEVSQWFQPIVI